MVSSRQNVLSTTLLAISATLVAALPAPEDAASSGNINTDMPFLSTVSQWSQPSETTVWWTPEATQSEWNWSTWSDTQAATSASSTVVAAVTVTGSTTAAYSNPFTIYTTMTNSDGVITGMPAVVTSQPSQPAVVTVCSGCSSVLSGQSSWISSVAALSSSAKTTSSKSMSTSTVSASGSATSTGFQQSQSTGAASRNQIAGSGAALFAVGIFAALL